MSGGGFRGDIEGLRGIAVGAVLLSHAGVPLASGGYVGVDVFFVISGFLITGLLVRELERSGTISIPRFYARRVRRLLPLAALVLATVVVLSQLAFSPVTNELVAKDVLAAAVYVVNWRFVSQAVDYFAQDAAASPVQHYWTLAIEEQFYVVWPVLLLLATWWWRRSGHSIRPALWALVAVVGGASLAYSVAFTPESPIAAYFSSFTRAWELALGAAIALAPLPRLGGATRSALAWSGLAAIAVAVVTYDSSTAFPGTAALLPTMGAAAIIVAGTGPPPGLASRMLGVQTLRDAGRVSYAWYLWHWPFLIFAAEVWGPLSVSQGIAVVVASWVPTVISHRLLEEPVHRSERFARRPRLALGIWAAGTGAAAGAAALLFVVQPSLPVAPAGAIRGAAVLHEDRKLQKEADRLRPEPRKATGDRGPLADDGCFLPDGETRSPPCVYGDRDSKTTVVLMGDSHAMHHFPALELIARQRGWRLVALTKAGCPPVALVKRGPLDRGTGCEDWRELAFRRIESEDPRMVVLSGATGYSVEEDGEKLEGRDREDALEDSYVGVLERLRDVAPHVVVLKDPPVPPTDIPGCVSESLNRLDKCSFRLEGGFEQTFETRAAARVEGAEVVDVTPVICPDGTCRSVIGDALVYRNKGHLTATFSATLAPTIARQLPRLR